MLKLSVRTRQFLRRVKPPNSMWRLGAFLGIKSLNAWMATLNYRSYRYDPAADPADASSTGPNIYVFWHEYIPFPVYTRPNSRLAMLLSQHQDAEILSHMAHFAGLETVRGSTSRGGTAALRELIERGKGMSLAITPDGPRGPRRHLAQGCIYLSSRLQIPIVPLGIGYDRPWRNAKSWDRFAIPRPFSRCRAILGPRIRIPPDIGRSELEHQRQWVQHQLQSLTHQAEQWAEQNLSIAGSEVLYRSPPSRSNWSQPATPNESLDAEPEVEPHLRVAG